MIKTAYVTPCGTYRYQLSRDWTQVGCAGRTLLMVMLNPSVADASEDDPTINKCMRYAKAHGFTALDVVNLYAFRATDPKALRDAGWPVGPENDTAIQIGATHADAICLAWGAFAARTPRAGEVIRLLQRTAPSKPLMCLDTTKDGHPAHPLYLKSSLRLRPFPIQT